MRLTNKYFMLLELAKSIVLMCVAARVQTHVSCTHTPRRQRHWPRVINENQSPTHTTKCQMKSTYEDQDVICHMEIWYEIRQSLDPVKLIMIYNPWKANSDGKKQSHLMAGTYSPASHLLREARRPALRTASTVNGSLSLVHLQGTETHPVHVTVLQDPEPWGQRRLSPLAPEREAKRETELGSKHQSLFWLGHGHSGARLAC